MINENQIYIVVDVETDGPVAGIYSMLSIGAVAITKDGEVGSFHQNLLPLEGATQDPSTMAWWGTQPDAWQEATANAEPAEKVINDFVEWIKGFEKRPVFVAHPVAFDYAVVSWYLWRFTKDNLFTDELKAPVGLDLSSYIAGKYGFDFDNSSRINLPTWMKSGMPEHSHNALDDARGFGIILKNILNKDITEELK